MFRYFYQERSGLQMMFVCCTCTILRIFYRTNRTDHHRCRLFYFLVNKGISLYISSRPSTKPPVSGKITSFVFSYIHCIFYKHRFITKQFCQLTGWNLKNYSVNFINCRCMSRFDTYGTSKNDNFPKVLVGHGLKKYGIKNLFTM